MAASGMDMNIVRSYRLSELNMYYSHAQSVAIHNKIPLDFRLLYDSLHVPKYNLSHGCPS